MNEASGCGFYPGPDAQNSVQQDRLRKCSLAIVEPAQADTQHATRNKEKITKKLSPKSYRQERLVSGVDRGFLTELLGRGQLKLANPLQVDVLPCDPQIMSVLHGKPALRGTPNRLGKT